jgi:hypothetical protein
MQAVGDGGVGDKYEEFEFGNKTIDWISEGGG